MAFIDFERGSEKKRKYGSGEQMMYLWGDMKSYQDDHGDTIMSRVAADGSTETINLDSARGRHHPLFPKFQY